MDAPDPARGRFLSGTAIPALPLALHRDRSFDAAHERAIVRYYLDAGVGGIAVGVHSTQFEIRDPRFALYEPVLELASKEIDARESSPGEVRSVIKIAGVVGNTVEATREA